MTGPIIKSTGFFEAVAPAIANDGVITQSEALNILDKVRGQGGIAPRELAQAKILKSISTRSWCSTECGPNKSQRRRSSTRPQPPWRRLRHCSSWLPSE